MCWCALHRLWARRFLSFACTKVRFCDHINGLVLICFGAGNVTPRILFNGTTMKKHRTDMQPVHMRAVALTVTDNNRLVLASPLLPDDRLIHALKILTALIECQIANELPILAAAFCDSVRKFSKGYARVVDCCYNRLQFQKGVQQVCCWPYSVPPWHSGRHWYDPEIPSDVLIVLAARLRFFFPDVPAANLLDPELGA